MDKQQQATEMLRNLITHWGTYPEYEWALVRKLIADGADVNSMVGDTPLLWHADWGDMRLFRLLLRAGADPDSTDRGGGTLLIEAAYSGSIRTVRYLLAAGANVNTRSKQLGNTPLMLAVLKGYLQIVRLLLAAGADPNIEGQDNATAIDWVELPYDGTEDYISDPDRARRRATYKALLDAGANPNHKTDDTWSPLEVAVNMGDMPLMRLLLRAGADPNFNFGNAFTDAARYHNIEAVKAMLAAGADPNIEDSDGYSPLFCAVEGSFASSIRDEICPHRRMEVIQTLLAAGANPNFVTPYPRESLIECAVRMKMADVANVLQAAQESAPEQPR